MSALEDLIERIVDRRVDARLRELGIKGSDYTSAHPPVSRRTFNEWCRSGRVVGAVADGRGWRCSAEAWRAARSAGKKPAKPAPASSPVLDDDEVVVAEMVRSSRRSA